jgi:hypothetical protein
VGLDDPALTLTAPLAALGLLALFTGRVLGPAVAGVGVGMGKLVFVLGLVGDVSSQVFAFAAMMAAVVTILAASRSRLPVVVRVGALTLGGFAVLPTVWALHQTVPDSSAALVAACASLLALLVAPVALGTPFTRAPAVVVGLVALGSLVRLVAVAVAFQGSALHVANFGGLARGIAAGALLLDAAAVAAALVWISSLGKKLTSPGTLVILALALFLTRQALAGQSSDAQGLDLLCWRAAGRLLDRPEAALPLALRIFVAFLAPLAAVRALFARGALGPLGAGVALALASRGALEMPPCALMLIVGALAVALTARDGRALWASLSRDHVISNPRTP